MRTLILGVLLFAAGCGSQDNGPGAGDPTDRSTYPASPYGKTEGSVIENLSFQAADGKAFTLNDVFKDPKNRVLLLHTAAGWCTACRDDAPLLEGLYGELHGKGLEIVTAYFQDDEFRTGTVAQVKGWIEQYSLTYPVVLDAPFVLEGYYGSFDVNSSPLNLIIDVDDMKILKITVGQDLSLVRSVIEANLDL